MGLLKHFVLPVVALLDALIAYKGFFNEADTIKEMIPVWAPGRDLDGEPLSGIELHVSHLLGATFLCFLVNAIVAIFREDAHYRGMALFLQLLFFLVDLCSYIKVGKDFTETPLVPILAFMAISLAIHSREPGIFTKDKEGEKKSK